MKRVLPLLHSRYLLLLMICLPVAPLSSVAAAAPADGTLRLLSAVETCLHVYDSLAGEDREGAATIDITEDCPGLAHHMENSAIAGSLHPPLADTVVDWQLILFHNILEASRRRQPGPAGYVLDHAALNGLLNGVYKPAVSPERTRSWWAAFREWLRARFPKMGGAPQLDRLAGWLDALLPSAQTVKFLMYGLLAAIFLTALGILLLEIRAAGLATYIRNFSRSGIRKPRMRPLPQPDPGAMPGLDEIRGLPLSARVPALLKLCIARLLRAGFIATDRGYTNRELLLMLQRRDASLSKSFAKLVNYADAYVYGGHAATLDGVEDSFRSAASILHTAV